LELLWAASYEAGDDALGDAADVEHLARWQGEPGLLVNTLLESKFIDKTRGGYRVHDLWDHAPDYVRKRRLRENERREKGAKLRRTADSDQSVTGQRPLNGRPPSPSPSPSPSPAQEAADVSSQVSTVT
jgi:hypothetical protein